MEETFEDAGHRVEVSVVVEVGKGVDLVQEALLEGVDVILKHAINVFSGKENCGNSRSGKNCQQQK